MKVTWITHLAMNSVCDHLDRKRPVSGGWLETMKMELLCTDNIELCIICVDKDKEDVVLNFHEDTIDYVYVGTKVSTYDGRLTKDFITNLNKCILDSKPDIIHIHGTEFPISLALQNQVIDTVPICVSIQGLISVIAERFYWGGLVDYENLSLLEKLPLFVQWKKALRRGVFEKEVIKKYHYFLGRTMWDFSHLKALNPDCKYYISMEKVREPFFNENNAWDFAKVEKHSIFCAGGMRNPIKGFHMVLQAAKILVKDYPDLKIYVTGNQLDDSIKSHLGYARYLRKKIKESGLSDRIIYTGYLTAERMADYFSMCHCYILASSIENSPNTLLEAMTIGTPSIVSLVGGVHDFVNEETAYIYRFEEYEMMASYIAKVFEDDKWARRMSVASRALSRTKQEKKQNVVDIYLNIIEDYKEKI